MKISSKEEFRTVRWYVDYEDVEYIVTMEEDYICNSWCVLDLETNDELEEEELRKKLIDFCYKSLDNE